MRSPRIRSVLAGCALAASLASAQGGFDGPGTYEIRNLKSGRVLDLDPRDRMTLVQFAPRGAQTQLWTISPAAPGYFYIRNVQTQAALEIIQDRNSAPVVAQSRQENPNQHWRIEPGKDGNAMFISRFGKALDVPDGSGREGLRLQIYDRNGDSNQRFTLRRVGGEISALPDVRDQDRDRDRDGDRDRDRDRRPDANGRYFDDRDRMWKMAGDGVCFYRDRDFRGDAVCTRAGDDQPDLLREGGGPFGSVKFFGRARQVVIYERPAFRGDAYRITGDESNLARLRASWTNDLGSRMGSFRVQ